MDKSNFSKKALQEGAQNYIVKEKADEHFWAQVHEKNISKNNEMPMSCMAGITPDLDNEARNIAHHFGWLSYRRFDVMTMKYLALLNLFNKKIAQRPKDTDRQSERFCRLNKKKRKLYNWWYFKGAIKNIRSDFDTVKKVKKILEIYDDQQEKEAIA